MQLMPQTAAALGVNPFDPVASRRAACRLLRRYLKRYGDVRLALYAYAWGSGNVNRGKRVPASVVLYADRVLERAGIERVDGESSESMLVMR